MGGHIGVSKKYKIAKWFHCWLGMFDCICALTVDCLICQNDKLKPKHRDEVPLEEWQNETQVDHKGPLHPRSNRNFPYLLFIVSIFHFLMLHPIIITGSQALTLLSKNKSTLLYSLSLVNTIVVVSSSTQISLTGLKIWETPYDCKYLTRPEPISQLRPRTNTWAGIGEKY